MKGRTTRLRGAMLMLAVATLPLTGCIDEAMGPAHPAPASSDGGEITVHGKVFERLNELNLIPLGDDKGDDAASDSTTTTNQEPTGPSGTRKPSKG